MNKYLNNFLPGLGFIFDIGSSNIKNPLEGTTDAERLAGDWQKVGDDMRKAMNIIDDELKDRNINEA